jgi:hypothetical protein
MTKQSYFQKNYETLMTSSSPIVIDEFTTAEYKLTVRNGCPKEYIVWITVSTDLTDCGMGFNKRTIKAVVLNGQTESSVLYEAFSRYFKNVKWGFRFGKDNKITA